MGSVDYDRDIVAWADKQARLLRNKRFELIDIEHIAEEIEDVGKSEQRELANRMAVLTAHLLKWQFQPERQSSSWERTIREQRKSLGFHLKKVPSLRTKLTDSEWLESVWSDAVTIAVKETGLENFPEICPWAIEDIFSQNWFPGNNNS